MCSFGAGLHTINFGLHERVTEVVEVVALKELLPTSSTEANLRSILRADALTHIRRLSKIAPACPA